MQNWSHDVIVTASGWYVLSSTLHGCVLRISVFYLLYFVIYSRMIDTCDDSRPILKRNLPGNWRHTNALKLRQGWYIAMQKSRAPSEQEILINILSETIIIMPLFEVPVLYFDKLKHQIWFKPLNVLQPSLHSSYKILLYWSWFSIRCLNHSIIIINADSFSIPTIFFIEFCLYLGNFTKAYKSFSPVRVISHVKGYMYHNSPKIEVPVPEFIERFGFSYSEWAFNLV